MTRVLTSRRDEFVANTYISHALSVLWSLGRVHPPPPTTTTYTPIHHTEYHHYTYIYIYISCI